VQLHIFFEELNVFFTTIDSSYFINKNIKVQLPKNEKFIRYLS